MKEGELLNEANLEVDRQALLKYYRSRGFADTEVAYDIATDPATEKATVTYNIVESGRMFVGDVEFEGNEALTGRQLRAVLQTKKKGLLSFLTKSGRIEQDKLTADVDAIRDLYQSEGYIDVLVGAPRIEPLKGAKVRVVYPITEGPQYHVGTVSVAGAEVFPEEEVRGENQDGARRHLLRQDGAGRREGDSGSVWHARLRRSGGQCRCRFRRGSRRRYHL